MVFRWICLEWPLEHSIIIRAPHKNLCMISSAGMRFSHFGHLSLAFYAQICVRSLILSGSSHLTISTYNFIHYSSVILLS